MREILGTLVGRWYVTVLGLVFLWRAVRHLGWRSTLTYTVFAVAFGALAENLSVHVGIPYTRYVFDPALRSHELFVGDVPLMVPLSYTFMGYFGFATGRLLASGPWHTRARRHWQEYLLGVVLTVWAVWVMDPVSRLGQRWFLGQLFHYRGPGFWFGLPLASQAGFTLTAAVLVGVLTWLSRGEEDRPVAGLAAHPHLVALTTYLAQLVELAVVALVLGADEIGGSVLLIGVPVVAVTAVAWSNLRPATDPAAASNGALRTGGGGPRPEAAPVVVEARS